MAVNSRAKTWGDRPVRAHRTWGDERHVSRNRRDDTQRMKASEVGNADTPHGIVASQFSPPSPSRFGGALLSAGHSRLV